MSVELLRTSRKELEDELRLAGAVIRATTVKCPFHEDKSPSGSIFCDERGVWRFRCHAPSCGFHGDVFDVRARRQSRDLADVLVEARDVDARPEMPAAMAPKAKRIFASEQDITASVSRLGPVEATYVYTNPDTGGAEVVQVRYRDDGKKRFLTHHAVDGGFVLGAPPKPWPLYNRRRVRAAKVIVVVEGEKCVHALHDIGIVATTSLSGAENADKADWSDCAGKQVYLWPDTNEAGHKFINAAAQKLFALNPPPTVELFDPSGLGLPEGGDVADFIAAGATAEEIMLLLREGSEPIGPGADLLQRLNDIIDGRWQSIDWKWSAMSRSCKSLFPGTITVICGDPSASKSFFVLEAMEHWHRQGIAVDLLELEDDRPFHLTRLLAVLSGTWDVLDDRWGREHPDDLRRMHAEHDVAIQSFAPHLHVMPLGDTKYADIQNWIKTRCEAGAKILAVDPITAIGTGDGRHIEDLRFIMSAFKVLREHEARLILVTHPREGFSNKRSTADNMAGGRAFSRHPQTVLLLHSHTPPATFKCMTSFGNTDFECNRTVRIAKARNAPGHGWRIGFSLGKDVRFHEHGPIVEKQKKTKAEDAPAGSSDEQV